MQKRIFILLLFAVVALVATTRSIAAEPPPFVVIVNPSNPSNLLSRKFITDAFLKKTTIWATGDVIRPADLGPDSGVRQRFSEDVLRRSVSAVKSYWQQMIFAGRDVPPPELSSDDEVVTYILKHPGGIGYVSGKTNLRGARVVTVQ